MTLWHWIVLSLVFGQIALAAALCLALRSISHLRRAIEAQGTRLALLGR